MHTKYNHPSKSLSPLSGHLLATLYSHNRPIFRLQEAAEILNSHKSATKILSHLTHNGVVSRLKSGLFQIVPFELGFEHEHLGNPFIVARELALSHKISDEEYFLSHGSAFDIHQMTTQPQLIVYTSSPKMIRPELILGTEFRFVCCKKKDVFGVTEAWLDKNEKMRVSDLERTLLDGLKQPIYCGGFSEVAKAFSIKHQMIDPQKIIDYAMKLDVGAVNRRLGYLMELYNIGSRIHWDFLRTTLTATYHSLDPELPAEGRHIAKWRLQLNIPEEELIAIRET